MTSLACASAPCGVARIACADVVVRDTTLRVIRSAEAIGCPSEAEWGRAIEEQLSRRSEGVSPEPAAEPLYVEVRVSRAGDEYRASLFVGGRHHGERHLTASGPECQGLADAVTATTALLVDGALDAAGLEPGSEKGDTAAGAPGQADDAAGQATPRAPSEGSQNAATQGALAARLALTYALPLGVSAAAGPDFELSSGRYGLVVGGYWAPPRETEPLAGGRAVVTVQAYGALLEPCAWLFGVRRALRVGGCGRLSLSRLSGEATGVDATSPAARPWLAAGALVRVAGPLGGRFGWRLFTGLSTPLTRESFSLTEQDAASGTLVRRSVYGPTRLSGELGAALTLQLW